MQKIAILTDTTSDIDQSIIKEYNIVEVPLQIIYNSENAYKDKFEKTLEDIIKDIDDYTIKTSLPLANDLISSIDELISKGYTHIIASCMSSGISGTFNLFEQILNTYNDKITSYVIDSKSCSMGMGFLLTKACQMIKNGNNFEDIVKNLELYKTKQDLFFTVDNLDYLYKGGRITRSTKFVGNLLNIKPIITCDKDTGKLDVVENVRGTKKVNVEIANKIKKFAENKQIDKIYIMHSNVEEKANELEQVILETLGDVAIYKRPISSLFVIHTGPSIYGAVVTLK